ncbi:related to Rhomboid protein 2 [Cephalotrichum gorgonifer]|uniref:rhomboid protease n=1 Tax=Cephalotrichum gorgonifer TaxID=2041049 RepID=A0AAE8N288_9PEZI|nr:related to Rhomboid protein 2 [Cephalotrichum gorgonifer]
MAASTSIADLQIHRFPAYISRLPPCTKVLILATVLASVVDLTSIFDIQGWGALIPDKVSIFSAHRANTYPFIHAGIISALFNIATSTPLIQRFEAQYGTLTALALFFGPLSTFPAFLYVLIDRLVLHTNATLMGSSVWTFLLLGLETARNRKTNPHLALGPYRVPTWALLLFVVVCTEALVPSTSLTGHLCGAAVGYACGLGLIKWLCPPEKVLRWLETKLSLRRRLPHYASVDQKAYGRFGVLPTSGGGGSAEKGVELGPV